jgi:hypothetical protein
MGTKQQPKSGNPMFGDGNPGEILGTDRKSWGQIERILTIS